MFIEDIMDAVNKKGYFDYKDTLLRNRDGKAKFVLTVLQGVAKYAKTHPIDRPVIVVETDSPDCLRIQYDNQIVFGDIIRNEVGVFLLRKCPNCKRDTKDKEYKNICEYCGFVPSQLSLDHVRKEVKL